MDRKDIQQVKLRFGIIGNDEELYRAIDVAMQVAPTDLSVLITGESGVGKESFPKIIHQFSGRKHGPYIAVNCGAIPEGTIDSELFGHEKGAFTGAIGERKGYFGEATGGTIFLDEVGELPLPTQARLLRVLESGEFIKVGSSKVEKTNVRIVAATNVKIPEAIQSGRFREDLYYRLSTVPIRVPALRERGEDIVLLFRKFAADFAEKYRMPAISLTDEAKQLLQGYAWPGNIRQLKNLTEQISIVERNREISAELLDGYLPAQPEHSLLPMLSGRTTQNRTFESDRELLYTILFDMRKDVTEMRRLIDELRGDRGHGESAKTSSIDISTLHLTPQKSASALSSCVAPIDDVGDTDDIQDAEAYVEEKFALPEIEKETILRALTRHKGHRKLAAQELHMSERTLYRKIKAYGLE